MLGAIIGDYVGSIYEMNNIRSTDFPFFSDACTLTDDTMMTIAIAEALLTDRDYANSFRKTQERIQMRAMEAAHDRTGNGIL